MPKPKRKKYEQISDAIVARIQEQRLAPGDKIGTEFELCDAFNVARGTVRQAIQQLIREDVLYAGQGSGTYVKRTVRADHLSTISLIVDPAVRLGQPFYASMVEGILKSAHARGYAVEYCAAGDSEGTVPRIRDAALVVLPKESRTVEAIHHAHIPLVVIDPQVEFPVLASVVRADDIQCGRMAAEHLIKLGHTRLATIAGNLAEYSGRMRLEGVRQALRSRGLNPAGLVVEETEFSFDGGHAAAARLFSRPDRDFTGLVCANDQMALAAINSALDHGIRVPQELSIVGIDGTISCRFSRPTLSSVDCRNDLKASEAVDLVIAHMKDSSMTAVERLVQPRLVKRRSSAAFE